MATKYGMSFILAEDENTRGREYTDVVAKRIYLQIRCTQRTEEQIVYMIYDGQAPLTGRGGTTTPLACLNFRANHALGTISIGQGAYIEMDKYLRVVRNDPLTRQFVASDGHTYIWSRKPNTQGELEWECVSSGNPGYHVASYMPKSSSSPPAFIVEEAYPQLAGEFLASFTVMRYIEKNNA